VLVVTFDPVVVAQAQPMRGLRAALAGVAGLEVQRLRRQREQLMVLARRLAGVLQ